MLQQEELLWFQILHCKWLTYGDHYIKYFNAITIVRKRNPCDTFTDGEGNWILEPDNLERLLTSYFTNRFTDDPPNVDFPRLIEEDKVIFIKEFTREEVHGPIFSTCRWSPSSVL